MLQVMHRAPQFKPETLDDPCGEMMSRATLPRLIEEDKEEFPPSPPHCTECPQAASLDTLVFALPGNIKADDQNQSNAALIPQDLLQEYKWAAISLGAV